MKSELELGVKKLLIWIGFAILGWLLVGLVGWGAYLVLDWSYKWLFGNLP